MPAPDIENAAAAHLRAVYNASSDRAMSEAASKAYLFARPILENGSDQQKNSLVRGLVTAVESLDPFYKPTYHASIDLALNSIFQGSSSFSAYTVGDQIADRARARTNTVPAHNNALNQPRF